MEHIQFRIVDIKQETTESKSYYIEDTTGRSTTYKAGQFITVIVTLHGKEVRRSYSICSTPGVDPTLFFTIKRVENGELSRYLLDTLKVDDIIICLPPTGRFTIEEPGNNLSVFIAAGSGITPVFSLVKHLLYSFTYPKVLLIYQNRDENESMFRQQLLLLAEKFIDRFQLKEIFSDPIDHNKPSQRLNNNLLERILVESTSDKQPQFYLCGPESFMRMVQFTLKVMKYDQDHIRKEDFYATAPPPPFMVDKTPHNVVINYLGQTHHLTVAYPQNILDAALKHQLKVPFSCRGGRCSTCTARCNSGKVKMSINDVLTPKDLSEGLILTCVSYAETDVEITFETISKDGVMVED